MPTEAATETLRIPVAGMTCDHCIGTVRRALESVPGVRKAAVTLDPGLAEVEVEPGGTDRDRLRDAIEAAGYAVPGAALVPTPTPSLVTIGPMPSSPPPAIEVPDVASTRAEEWNLAIGGMHCASCVGRVEGALRSVAGVVDARGGGEPGDAAGRGGRRPGPGG